MYHLEIEQCDFPVSFRGAYLFTAYEVIADVEWIRPDHWIISKIQCADSEDRRVTFSPQETCPVRREMFRELADQLANAVSFIDAVAEAADDARQYAYEAANEFEHE
jgi:hypothetical protein